jgi:hypothetical protein
LGHVKSEEGLDDLAPPCADEGNDAELLKICMSVWFRWTLQIDRTLHGPPIKGRIATARVQHTGHLKWYLRSVRLFVLTPIEDPKKRRLLRADYFLDDLSAPTYCLSGDPEDLGLENNKDILLVYSTPGYYCFDDPEAYRPK